MNKKAFTLTELLAVIVILAIIATITTPVVLSVINDSKEKSCNQQLHTIRKAAQTYVTTMISEGKEDEIGSAVTIEQLYDAGFLNSLQINNPVGGVFDQNFEVGIQLSEDGLHYTYVIDNTVCEIGGNSD